MQFSVIVPQGWKMDLVGITDPVKAYETMVEFTRTAEQLGYSCAWLFDHFHTVPEPTQEYTFESWTTTAALTRDTKTIHIGQMVTCNNYRNPALLAKMASTVDAISNGRLRFGIGAGWYEQEYLAYGYEFPDGPTRLKQLREALQIILAMWTHEKATFTGKFYRINEAINQPKGVQKPHIPLLVAGAGEQVTLKLVAQYADACNVLSLSPEETAGKYAILKDHCKTVGREYSTIKKTLFLNCAIDEDESKAITRSHDANFIRNAKGKEFVLSRSLVGTPERIKQRLQEYEASGVEEIIVYFPQEKRLESLTLFASSFIRT